MHILAMVSTKNRYNVLPMTIEAVISQSRKPDEFIIFDDNDSPIDLRELPLYRYLFKLMDNYGIKWQVLFGEKKGQHHNHQRSQELATDLIWRLDDDIIPEPDVLEKLERRMVDGVGAVGGLVLEPEHEKISRPERKRINDTEYQWYEWTGDPIEAEHLYSTFLYRKGLADYNLALSNVAHREETIFTHKIFLKGYKLIIDPSIITWHLREGSGGIRTYLNEEMWKHDENVFQMWLKHKYKKLVILDSGLGDHFAFLNILPKLKEKYGKVLIACCYPEVFEGEEVISIEEGCKLENPELHNIYAWMDKHNWKQSIIKAYENLYNITL